LNWLLSLPWDASSDERLDLAEAERILDEDHAGLDAVKERILECLSIMLLHRNNKAADGSAPPRLPVPCLVGPPGIGKTSISKSIARALGRKFMKFSLGGLHDDVEIRGSNRVYSSPSPGRLIKMMMDAKVNNPVIMMDELDKICTGGGVNGGDPSAALLEVLDPEQNSTFRDNYLEVDFDLSQALFICTANDLDMIPPALKDRLEIIELRPYTLQEKLAIAKNHLVPQALKENSMDCLGISFDDAAIEKMINGYANNEPGVRGLKTQIARVLGKLALKKARGETFDPAITEERFPELLGEKTSRRRSIGFAQ
jgi:ATP-dependent Lon protease